MLNIQNCVHYLKNVVSRIYKIVDIEYRKQGTFKKKKLHSLKIFNKKKKKKLSMLNIQNCVHFLKKVYIKSTKLSTLCEKMCMLNIQNYIFFLKNCIH